MRHRSKWCVDTLRYTGKTKIKKLNILGALSKITRAISFLFFHTGLGTLVARQGCRGSRLRERLVCQELPQRRSPAHHTENRFLR